MDQLEKEFHRFVDRHKRRERSKKVLEALGASAIVAAGGLWDPRVGLFLLGLALINFSFGE